MINFIHSSTYLLDGNAIPFRQLTNTCPPRTSSGDEKLFIIISDKEIILMSYNPIPANRFLLTDIKVIIYLVYKSLLFLILLWVY